MTTILSHDKQENQWDTRDLWDLYCLYWTVRLRILVKNWRTVVPISLTFPVFQKYNLLRKIQEIRGFTIGSLIVNNYLQIIRFVKERVREELCDNLCRLG